MTDPKNSLKISPVILVMLLSLVNFFLYGQVRNFDFILLDDHAYVLNPMVQAGLTLDGLRWAFTAFDHNTGNWHPLTWLSLMLDRQLYGMDAGGYHLTNLLIHMANTMLLFVVLHRMTDKLWRSALVAFLFAVHPLHIESIVWVSERKDLLCAFFWLLATGSYFKYIEHLQRRYYVLTFILFALALMAKPMAVTFPFCLLLLDYWPLCRFQQRHDLIKNVINDRTVRSLRHQRPNLHLFMEKGPFFALSLISSVITLLAQQSSGAVQSLTNVPLFFRIVNTFEAYFTYIVKMLWPHDLAVIYPLSAAWPFWHIVFAISLILSVTAMVVHLSNNHPYLFTGWFWYVGTLVPVIGLVQVGEQSMADRYTYIPLMGLFIIMAWGAADIISHKKSLRNAFCALSVFFICGLMIVSWFQIQKWRNSLTLFQHTLSVTRENYLAHSGMGSALQLKGDLKGAEHHFKEAIRIRPRFAEAHNKLGIVYRTLDNFDLATAHFREAIQISPRHVEAHFNLGQIYLMQKKYAEAIVEYDIVLKGKQDHAKAHHNRGVALFHLKDIDGAIQEFEAALRIDPEYIKAKENLANALEMRTK
jgi:Tfp pilus assembly protein PilF